MNPANAEAFVSFVDAGWRSLAEDVEEISWEGYVRRALRLYPDDWDRYEPGRLDELPTVDSRVMSALKPKS
jgi:hypothetical protein